MDHFRLRTTHNDRLRNDTHLHLQWTRRTVFTTAVFMVERMMMIWRLLGLYLHDLLHRLDDQTAHKAALEEARDDRLPTNRVIVPAGLHNDHNDPNTTSRCKIRPDQASHLQTDHTVNLFHHLSSHTTALANGPVMAIVHHNLPTNRNNLLLDLLHNLP